MSRLADSDRKVVLDFLGKVNIDSPFPESESYYSRSSHSGHDDMFFGMHHGSMRNIFSVACNKNSTTYQKVAADLEKVFIIGYALSAVHDELNKANCFYESGQPRWFHDPFPSGWVTLSDKWNDDFRVPIGCVVKDSAGLKADPLVVQAYKAYERVYETCLDTIEFQEGLAKLHQTLKGVLDQLVQRVKKHC